jgi:hypothetical protein
MAQVTTHSILPDQDFSEGNSALMFTSTESQHSSERSPLSNFGFLKNLGLDKKQTKGMRPRNSDKLVANIHTLHRFRWGTAQATRAQAR